MAKISDNILDFTKALSKNFHNNIKRAILKLKSFEQEIFSKEGTIYGIISYYRQKNYSKIIIELMKLL